MIERRLDPRSRADISVVVWGTDARGEPFSQSAVVSNISNSGALLSRIERALRTGDLIGIAYQGRKARFRVIWGRESGGCIGIRVAVQKLVADPCPWKDILSPMMECLAPEKQSEL
jgi:hypothetical protein